LLPTHRKHHPSGSRMINLLRNRHESADKGLTDSQASSAA